MITRQSVSDFGASLENLMRVLVGIIQQKEAEKTAKGFFTPQPTMGAPRPFPLTGANAGGMGSLQTFTGVEQQPNLQAILQGLMSMNPQLKEMAGGALSGLGMVKQLQKPDLEAAKFGENVRQGQAREQQARQTLEETRRANLGREGLGERTLQETKRYHTGVLSKPILDKRIHSYTAQDGKERVIFQRPDGETYEKLSEEVKYQRPAGAAKTTEQINKLNALESNLRQYENLILRVPGGRIGGTISKGKALVEMSPEARTVGGLENTLTGLIARIIGGEVGVLTDQDIARAKAMLPQILDNPQERKLKFDMLKQLISERRQAFSGQGMTGEKSFEEMTDEELAAYEQELLSRVKK